MENIEQLRPLTREERKFSEENYHLIMDFMKKSKLDAEEFFDIVVFDFLLLSVLVFLVLAFFAVVLFFCEVFSSLPDQFFVFYCFHNINSCYCMSLYF